MLSKDKVKKQARLLVELLAAHQGPVQYQDALELLARLNGNKNWKTMSALLDKAPAASQVEEVPAPVSETGRFQVIQTEEGAFEQTEVPGTGFLFRVPVAVDTSMSCVVLVRAQDRGEAVDLARTLVSEGNAPMEVDDGNYRGRADYYCPDSSSDSVYRLKEPNGGVATRVESGCQVGGFLVELFDLGDGEDSLLYADLTVFDPEQPEREPLSAMSCLGVDATQQERQAFSEEVARTLAMHVPDVSTADNLSIVHAFVHLVQGGVNDATKRYVAKLFTQ